MTVAVVLFLLGLAVLVAGSEMIVQGAARVATTLGISPMVIGLTIVSIGTSAPEFAVGITAAVEGKGAMAVANIAGTNVVNLLFILGLSALLRPLPLHLQIFKLELPVIAISAALMTVLAWDGVLSQWDGGLMLIAGIVYTVLLVRVTRRASKIARKEFGEEYGPDTVLPTQPRWWGRFMFAVELAVGILLTVLGAECVVRGAVAISLALGVSSTIIGLTVLAIGTSAPELVTTIYSTIKDDRDVAIGNLLGSSIYNILVILSITCIVVPGGLPVEPQLLWFDIPLMAGVAIGAIPVFVTGTRVSRLEGLAGVAIYVAYLLWLVLRRA